MEKIITLLSSLIIFCCIQSNLNAQTPLTISLQPTYGKNTFDLNTKFPLNNKDSISFEMLKFYISNIELYNNETKVWKAENSFRLVNYENSSSLEIVQYIPLVGSKSPPIAPETFVVLSIPISNFNRL